MRNTALACHDGYGLPELYSNNNGNNKENASIENKYLPACVYFEVLPLSSHSTMLEKVYKWLVCKPLNYLYSSYTFSVALSSCKQNNKCGNFTLLFSRGAHGFVLKSLPHVQHAYFSQLEESNSLRLSHVLANFIF